MRIEARLFGIAAGVAAAVLYTLCALLVAVAPDTATNVFGFVMHMDLSGVARPISLAGYLCGVAFWGIGTGLVFGFAAGLYDWLLARAEPTSRSVASPAAATQ